VVGSRLLNPRCAIKVSTRYGSRQYFCGFRCMLVHDTLSKVVGVWCRSSSELCNEVLTSFLICSSFS